jgi:hypothetical protein
VADDSLPARLALEAVALSGGDRELLHRVLGMLVGDPADAGPACYGWIHAGPGKAGDLHYGDHITESGRVMRVKMILTNQHDTNYRDLTLAEPGGTEHHRVLHVSGEVQRVEPTPETVNGMRAERRALYTRLVRDHGLIGWESRGNDPRGVAEDLDDLRGMAADVEGQAPEPLGGIPAGYHGLARQAIDDALARAPALSGDDEAADLAGPQGVIHGPDLRAVLGDGTRPQERELTAAERAGLGGVIRRLIEEWEGPRLFQEPIPAWDLSGADIARLELIRRAVTPPPEAAGRPLVVNAADWAPPEPVPADWVIANAPQPIQGPVGARAWEAEERHGRFYAAWPVDVDDDIYWEQSGAREVLLITNQGIARDAGRFLAACGLLPGEGGLTATEVARRIGHPWKDGIVDDEQITDAALAVILELRRDDEQGEDIGYDGSDGPQRRELTGDERAFLSRLAGHAAADPRWAGEAIAQRPGIRAALGDGSGPQARPLTARERDDVGRLVMLVDGRYHHERQHGYEPLSPWMGELAGGDIARLNLVRNAITPRHGTPYLDGPVLVSAADWAPPEPVPDGWVTGNAPVPIGGPVSWQGPDLGNGKFYAAAPDHDDPYGGWLTESAAARRVEVVTDEQAVEAAYVFLAEYGCTGPGDVGMTIDEVARDLGYPLPAGRSDAAVTAAGTTWTLQATRRDLGQAHWYAVHGSHARDWTTAEATRGGYQVTPAVALSPAEASPAGASPGARAMVTLALQHGWDVAYIRGPRGEQVTALNADIPGERVDQAWDATGRLVGGDDLVKIGNRPRSRCAVAPGAPGPVACEFPQGLAAAPPRGSRPARSSRRPAPRPRTRRPPGP